MKISQRKSRFWRVGESAWELNIEPKRFRKEIKTTPKKEERKEEHQEQQKEFQKCLTAFGPEKGEGKASSLVGRGPQGAAIFARLDKH